ncbi:MAG: AAA family ATPase [Bacillota bacterium]|nr:AAA family ATPase [Bacillota bacterium]
MKIVSLFNNKGGVGKSTLSYHLGCALGELGKKVLFVDLDPQCNLTIHAMFEEELENIWEDEDPYIDDLLDAQNKYNDHIFKSTRSIHFLLKPIEDGINEFDRMPPAKQLFDNVFLIPGRLSLHKFETKLSERWNGLYQGDALSIRTVTAIRTICEKYAQKYNCDYVIVDTSPSLGIMNKTIISTVDGFFIPTFPDMFSLYGIKNIGNSLEMWQKEFETIYQLISTAKSDKFPKNFVRFIGFTIYNAKKYTKSVSQGQYSLASAHSRYVHLIPKTIKENIREKNMALELSEIEKPMGGESVMYSHNTYPSVAQSLKCPMWKVPDTYTSLKKERPDFIDQNEIQVNNALFNLYKQTLESYKSFARNFISRAEVL